MRISFCFFIIYRIFLLTHISHDMCRPIACKQNQSVKVYEWYFQFSKYCVLWKNIWMIINTITSNWLYPFPEAHSFLKLCSQKTVHFLDQIYPQTNIWAYFCANSTILFISCPQTSPLNNKLSWRDYKRHFWGVTLSASFNNLLKFYFC